jgi:hypothetical protein
MPTFSWRRTHIRDLPESLRLHPAKLGSEFVGYSRAIRAWREILDTSYATRSAVVEARNTKGVEIVGFGLATFVKKSFAENVVKNPEPGLNARIIKRVDEGKTVIATYADLRDANTRGDLEQIVLDTSWKVGTLTPAEVNEVRVLLGQAYLHLYSGYRFSRILGELIAERDFWHIRGQRCFHLLSRFERFRGAGPNSAWSSDRALFEVTAESMRNDPHSVAAPLFRHVRPQFGFTSGEQELLELALDGAEDPGIANTLLLTRSAIKRRWSTIFERVASINPELAPASASGIRGAQKRQRILTYVRSHPEELRPFDFRRYRDQPKRAVLSGRHEIPKNE